MRRTIAATLIALAFSAQPIRAEDSFAIVGEDATKTSRVVSVRIERRLDADGLARIATNIRSQNSTPAMRHTVVSFFLPGMPLDQRPWASVDTTPTTKVVVGGLKIEEAQRYAAQVAAERRDLIGAWLTDFPSEPGRIAIYNEKGRARLEWVQRNGATIVEELVETRGTRGVRYDLKSGGDEHYLLKSSGVLEIKGKDRLIARAERIDRTKTYTVATGSGEEGAVEPSAAIAEDAAANAKALEEARKPRLVKRVKRAPKAAALIDYNHMRPLITN